MTGLRTVTASRSFSRRAFTIVELLVVITIIGILMGLLLPAVNAARESSRRMECSNNQRNLALATIEYEQSHKQFPGWFNWHGHWELGKYDVIDPFDAANDLNEDHYKLSPWHVSLLPFLDQQELYERWNEDRYPLLFEEDPNSPWVGAHHRTMYPNLSIFICPSSPFRYDYGTSSYVSNNGVYSGLTPAGSTMHDGSTMTFERAMRIWNGPFNNQYRRESDFGAVTPIGPGVKLDDFIDGESQTAIFSENMQAMRWQDIAHSSQPLPHPLVHRITHLLVARQKYYHGFVWFPVDTGEYALAPEPDVEMLINNDRYNDVKVADDPRLARPSSAHVDGVVMAMADGRIQFISDSIDYRVYQALITLRGKSSDVPFMEFVLDPDDI